MLKSTGIVRKLDQLGRVVIPKEIRGGLNIAEKDPMEILIDGDRIILRKYQSTQACHITGEITSENISLADGKLTLSPTAVQQLVAELKSRGLDE
ncbi:AbrB/MazE/SpoVT family DNA-binding domain-containing protein [Bacillus horti]|uniref:Transcriptional pleiotropic regulator of transition state genes n=1 Tax=Caldalkalibacillus horti TaxID=77523 RepID=A0ABT9VWX6_9BACI|nr:AbrB/MazE/SpoVT family DNA-binding domain-containing protein [Bacillus horti]MDQ0165483.1 transcriptional pleiotropic regulator of transition state genes [Bacillus horti]